MKIFDFLNSKDKKEMDDFVSPHEQTQTVHNLCTIPIEKRDIVWQEELLRNIPFANFRVDKPRVIEGPDGMKYIQLRLPSSGNESQKFIICDQLVDLLEEGCGIAINANKPEPDWVLSYGDIVNYSINREFLTTTSVLGIDENRSFENMRVRQGDPSEIFLPLSVRRVIKEHFKSLHLSPKICLIQSVDDDKLHLAFDIIPPMFENKEDFHVIMRSVQWFLPRHYSIIGKATDNCFVDL